MEEKIKFSEMLTQEIRKEQEQSKNNISSYKKAVSGELAKQKKEIFEALSSTKKPNKIKNFFNKFFQVWG